MFKQEALNELWHILDRLEIAIRKFKSGHFSTLMDAIVATRRTIIKLGAGGCEAEDTSSGGGRC